MAELKIIDAAKEVMGMDSGQLEYSRERGFPYLRQAVGELESSFCVCPACGTPHKLNLVVSAKKKGRKA